MNSYNVNVVVHIDENLSSEQIQDMEKRVSMETGVHSACVHDRTPHLMVIDYDPREVGAGQLLRSFHNNGLHAELVGGI
jgi:hypothetical protein